jgi:arsenite methyltransferase
MHSHFSATTPNSNYTLNPERLLWHAALVGSLAIAAGFVLHISVPTLQPTVPLLIVVIGLVHLLPLAFVLLMVRPSRRLNARNQMMNAVSWRGDEQVLDVGCGNGILTFEAAKHLKTGKAVGIDIWDHSAGQQTADHFRRNAQIEGVADRVELREVDARTMPFPNASFDVIFASLSLHHTGNRADRAQVVKEMVRVLKPGGSILFYDIFPIISGASHDLQHLGITRIQRLGGHLIQILRADKVS